MEYKVLKYQYVNVSIIVLDRIMTKSIPLLTVAIQTKRKGWRAHQAVVSTNNKGSVLEFSRKSLHAVVLHGIKLKKEAACLLFPEFENERYHYNEF